MNAYKEAQRIFWYMVTVYEVDEIERWRKGFHLSKMSNIDILEDMFLRKIEIKKALEDVIENLDGRDRRFFDLLMESKESGDSNRYMMRKLGVKKRQFLRIKKRFFLNFLNGLRKRYKYLYIELKNMTLF